MWYDFNLKKSAYYHNTYYEDGTERSFRLIAHFNDVSTKHGDVTPDLKF